MVSFERKVGPKGQVVIPKEIRKNLGIFPSAAVFLSVSNHTVVITKTKQGITEMLAEQVKKDGKYIKKVDTDKLYEKQIRERWRGRP